eukprot:NODE_2138_length_1674_cov_151.159897_g1827_i0.p1 GENE.NODE_2138_length_1674_cov_151.159897_g1827_i0~~NODE_2138_length_1674_cov_151.159897_g1827_i0.p1  ORF type:complete len:487 (+),score=70.48 NODE_2138_length_1674_cov_151.159897_g1827_i0:97-1557(+)
MAEAITLSDDSLQFTIRHYTPQDDKACRELLFRAPPSSMKKLYPILTSKRIMVPISSLGSQYPQSIIAVCEDIHVTSKSGDKLGPICGLIVVGIAVCYLQGRPLRLGWVLKLAVREHYDYNKIGRRLIEYAETECYKADVSVMHLSVHADSLPAFQLAKDCGFEMAGVRTLHTSLLVSERPSVSSAVIITRLTLEEAEDLLRSHLSHIDFAPLCMACLLRSPCYQGTYMATYERCNYQDAVSFACLSIWDHSAFCQLEVVKFLFLPITLWKNKFFWLVLLSIIVSLSYLVVKFLLDVHSAQEYGALVMFLSLICGGVMLLYGASKPLDFIRLRVMCTDQRYQTRLFAPVATGIDGKRLFKSLHTHLHNIARDRGCATVRVDIGKHHPLYECLASGGLQKLSCKKHLRGSKDYAEASCPVHPHECAHCKGHDHHEDHHHHHDDDGHNHEEEEEDHGHDHDHEDSPVDPICVLEPLGADCFCDPRMDF